MDTGQQYDVTSYGYSESGTQKNGDGDLLQENRPYHPPGPCEIYEQGSMVSPLAHTSPEFYTGMPCSEGEASGLQRGCGISPLHKSYFGSAQNHLNNEFPYSDGKLQGTSNGYVPFGWGLEHGIQRRGQDSGISDVVQSGTGLPLRFKQRQPESNFLNDSNVEWRPVGIIGHKPVFVNGAASTSYSPPPTACANCGCHLLLDKQLDHHGNQRVILSNAEWWLQRSDVLPNRQPTSQEIRRDVPSNQDVEPGNSEESRSGLYDGKPPPVDDACKPVITYPDGVSKNKRKRRRKPGVPKPRKTRTMTQEGKVHAKAIRDLGGVCDECKRKKTKVRDPLIKILGSTIS